MKCSEYQLLISAYVDGMLDPQDTKVLLEHLEHCDACQLTYEALSQIVNSLQELDDEPLPEGFHQNLMQNIKNESASYEMGNEQSTATLGNCLGEKLKTFPKKKIESKSGMITNKGMRWGGALVATFLGGFMILQMLNNGKSWDSNYEATACEEGYTSETASEAESAPAVLFEQKADRMTKSSGESDLSETMGQEAESISPLEREIGQQTESVAAYIVVQDQVSFEEQFETYLASEQIDYEKSGSIYSLKDLTNKQASIRQWLEENSEITLWTMEDALLLKSESLILEIKSNESSR